MTKEINLLSVPLHIYSEIFDLTELTESALKSLCELNGIKNNLTKDKMIIQLQKLQNNEHPSTKYYGHTWVELAMENKGKIIIAAITLLGSISTMVTTIIVQSNITLV